jgi:hypothetical protein
MRITLLCKILIAGVCSSTALACNNIHNDPAFEFYYYPARNVYYDVSNGRYIYSLNGGRTWDTLYKKAEAGSPTLGKKRNHLQPGGESVGQQRYPYKKIRGLLARSSEY